jgi:hypothetical protein
MGMYSGKIIIDGTISDLKPVSVNSPPNIAVVSSGGYSCGVMSGTKK